MISRNYYKHISKQEHPESTNLPMPKFQPKLIRDLNPDFRINRDPDPDLCRICPKMLWMHYLFWRQLLRQVWYK